MVVIFCIPISPFAARSDLRQHSRQINLSPLTNIPLLDGHSFREETAAMSDLASVARRLEREVGLPAADAMRIARKLDKLAGSVSWGTSIAERDEQQRKARDSAKVARRKSSKAHSAKKR
jgi:hypothetical protein